MKFIRNVKLEACDKKKKICYVLKKKNRKKRFGSKRVRTADDCIEVQCNNHCTSELCIQIESSFYIITYSSWLNSNQKPAKRFLPSEDFKNRKYILIMMAQPIFDLKSIDFTP